MVVKEQPSEGGRNQKTNKWVGKPRQAHKRASLYKSLNKRTQKGPTRTKAIGTTLPKFLTCLLCLLCLTVRPARQLDPANGQASSLAKSVVFQASYGKEG